MVDSLECKKWTLFTLCLVQIVITLIITIVSCVLINEWIPTRPAPDVISNWDDSLLAAKNTVIAVGVVVLVFQLLGLIASYCENLILTLLFAFLMALVTLGCIALAIRTGAAYWVSFVVNLFVTIAAIVYAYDLNQQD